MKRLVMMCAVVLAGCGGNDSAAPAGAFSAEHAIGEVRDGAPFCDPGATGTGLVPTTPDPLTPDVAETAECHWTCAEVLGFDNRDVTIAFYRLAGDAAWHRSVSIRPPVACPDH